MTNDELKEYYSNLLISQYKDNPKNKEHVGILVELNLIFELIRKIEKSFSTEAKGDQLDKLAKYAGVSRTSRSLDVNTKFFGSDDYYDDDDTVLPSGSLDYGVNISVGDTFTYTSNATETSQAELKDSALALLIGMKWHINQNNMSLESIDRYIKKFFGNSTIVNELVTEPLDDVDKLPKMTLRFLVDKERIPEVVLAVSQGAFPKPAGVNIEIPGVTAKSPAPVNLIYSYLLYGEDGDIPENVIGAIKYGQEARGWTKTYNGEV